MKKTIFVGVDPGYKTMGVTTYSTNKKEIIYSKGHSFFTFMELIEKIDADQESRNKTAFVIENPDLDSMTFGAWSSISKVIAQKKPLTNKIARAGRKNPFRSVESTVNFWLSRAQDAGSNALIAKIIIVHLEMLGYPVLQVAPTSRKKAKPNQNPAHLVRPTKLTAKQFKKLTGYKGSTNGHGRDAGTLVWGMTFPNFKMLKLSTKQKKYLP